MVHPSSPPPSLPSSFLQVIGIVHLPSCAPGAIGGIEAEFHERVKEFPHAVAKKVFCFGHSFGAAAAAGEGGREEKESLETMYANKEELVIFPPEGDHVDSGMSMVELHMGVMLNDVAVVVLSHLEGEVSRTRAGGGTSSTANSSSSSSSATPVKPGSSGGASSSSSSSGGGKTAALAKRGGQWLAGLRSPFDDDSTAAAAKSTTTNNTTANSSSSSSSALVGVGGNHGRLNKWVGDLCLLAGTPQDALEAYIQAIGECKAAGEGLWQAGALEGWIAAVEVMQLWRLPLEEYLPGGREGGKEGGGKKQQEVVWKEVEERGGEALVMLEVGGAAHASLAVALCFKMARVQGGREGGVGVGGRYVEAWGWVMRAMGLGGLGMVSGRRGREGGSERGSEGRKEVGGARRDNVIILLFQFIYFMFIFSSLPPSRPLSFSAPPSSPHPRSRLHLPLAGPGAKTRLPPPPRRHPNLRTPLPLRRPRPRSPRRARLQSHPPPHPFLPRFLVLPPFLVLAFQERSPVHLPPFCGWLALSAKTFIVGPDFFCDCCS